ncbi:hypothetical protein [Desulfogranum mediterraneum]|nr:hypothetical protein [Desulfogranum mediterraneum]
MSTPEDFAQSSAKIQGNCFPEPLLKPERRAVADSGKSPGGT